MELSPEVKEFANQCGVCGVCREACPLLAHHGTPGELLGNNPEDAFLCTNCGACNSICPAGLSPAGLFLRVKQGLTQAGQISHQTQQSLASARRFVMTGHWFPFAWYPRSDTVFWPGCALSATGPNLVKKTRNTLEKQLGQPVGLIFDCCFDPLYQRGDSDSVKAAVERIQKQLENRNITRIITGCINCQKVLSSHLHGVKVSYLLEVLAKDSFKIDGTKSFFLHHPCSAFSVTTAIPAIKKHLSDDVHIEASSQPLCCGNGGGIATLCPELADQFTAIIMDASAAKPIITYCMGCKTRFAEKGKEAYHILEFLPGSRLVQKNISPLRNWINRFILAMGQRTGRWFSAA